MVALLAAMAFCGALNMAVERVAYRRLRNAPRLAPLITAIGMWFILRAAQVVIGFDDRRPTACFLGALFNIGESAYRQESLIVVLITIPVAARDDLPRQRTRAGKAMRATAQDRDAARHDGHRRRPHDLVHVRPRRRAGRHRRPPLRDVLHLTRFDLGFQLGLFAFTAAVLGGIGNLTGAALGGLLIGLIQAFNEGLSWHAPGSDWTQSIVFSILILILVFRPQGLLGEATGRGHDRAPSASAAAPAPWWVKRGWPRSAR